VPEDTTLDLTRMRQELEIDESALLKHGVVSKDA
jgi:hypothetical protein